MVYPITNQKKQIVEFIDNENEYKGDDNDDDLDNNNDVEKKTYL